MRIIVNVSVKTSMYRIIIFNLAQEDKNKLSEMTGLTEKKIDSWFHKKRLRSGVSSTYKCNEPLSKRFPQLEQQFQTNPNPTESEKLHLVETTGLTRKQISMFFLRQKKKHQL